MLRRLAQSLAQSLGPLAPPFQVSTLLTNCHYTHPTHLPTTLKPIPLACRSCQALLLSVAGWGQGQGRAWLLYYQVGRRACSGQGRPSVITYTHAAKARGGG